MGRQALQQEDRLVEMIKRTIGVDAPAEQRDVRLRECLAASPRSSESVGIRSVSPGVWSP